MSVASENVNDRKTVTEIEGRARNPSEPKKLLLEHQPAWRCTIICNACAFLGQMQRITNLGRSLLCLLMHLIQAVGQEPRSWTKQLSYGLNH
eukprot:IDg11618t1